MIQRPVLTLAAVVQITRPQIALQAALYMLLGAYLEIGAQSVASPVVWSGAIIVGLIVAFGFVINDYEDRELDRLSKADRPIPSGLVPPPAARTLALLLAAACLAGSFILPQPLQLIAVINLGLTALYAVWLKRTVLLGNITIAWLNASVLLFGALAVGLFSTTVMVAAIMSFFYSFAQEVLYTIDDCASDTAGGIVTTAIFFGVEKSLWLYRILLCLAAITGLGLMRSDRATVLSLIALMICTIMPILMYLLPLTWRATSTAVAQSSRAVRLIRVSSLVPLLLLPGA